MWCFHPSFPLYKCIFSPLHDMLSLRQSCSTVCVYMYSSLCECGPAKPSKHNRVFCPDNVYRTLLFTVCFPASRVITVRHGWHAFPSPLVSRGTAIMFFLYACASGSPEGRSDVTLLKKRFSIVSYNWILLEFNWLFIENRFTVIVLLKIHDHRWLWSAEAVSHLWLNKFRCFIWQRVSSRYMHSF